MATVSGKIFQVKDGTTNLFPRTVIEAVYGLDKTIADVKTWVGNNFVKYSHSIYNPTSAVDLNSQHVAENTIQQISWDFSTYSNVSNRPFSSASAASVLVLPNTWGGLQFYTDYNSNTYYIRNRYSTTGWKSWVQLYHTGNFNPANYLPIAAQGATVYRTTSGPIVSFNNSKGANEEAYLIFQSNGTSKTAVGWNSTRGTYIYNYPSAKYLGIKDDGTPNYQGNTLWHSGNSNLYTVNWVAAVMEARTRVQVTGGADAKIVLDNTDSETNFQYISFRQNGTQYGRLGTFGSTGLAWNGMNIYHTGNLTSSAITGILASGSIANGKLANSSITINGTSTSLGGTFNTASITAGTVGTSSATSGLSFAVPYVTLNAYGVATAYGTHTHSISKANITSAIGSTTYAPYNSAGYLPLSGGTMTGALTISGNSATITSANGKAWRLTGTSYDFGLYLATGGTNRGIYQWATPGQWMLYFTASDTILNYGNVGIGTTSPSYKLDVTGSIRAAERVVATTGFGTVDTPASAYVASPGWYRIWSSNVNDIGGNNIILFINRSYGNGQPENFAFEINIEGNGAISITQLSGNRQSTEYQYLTKLRVVWAYNTANSVFIDFYYDSSSSNAIRVHGYAGKGQFQPAVAVTDTPANAVEFDLLQDCFKTNKNIVAMGTIRSTTGIFSDGYVSALGTASSSDAKLKDDITTISYDRAKAVLSALNPREWTWNSLTSKEGERGAGMVAQEVEPILPDTVKEIGGNLTLEYNTLFAYGLAMTKYLVPAVESLEERVARLERENEELKRQLTN